MFLLIWEREQERNIDVREKQEPMVFCTCPDRGLNLQPRYVPWESNLQPFGVQDNALTNWAATWLGPDSVYLYS